jgi:hypothetical protein
MIRDLARAVGAQRACQQKKGWSFYNLLHTRGFADAQVTIINFKQEYAQSAAINFSFYLVTYIVCTSHTILT